MNGLIFENPIFSLMLGMCPTLGITTAGSNGLGMTPVMLAGTEEQKKMFCQYIVDGGFAAYSGV